MKLIVLLSDFCNDEFLADVLLVIPVRGLEIGGLAVFGTIVKKSLIFAGLS